jgi:hypothetical protein
MFRCRACRRTYNERTNTPYNHLQVPTDVAVLVVLWRLQHKLSLRNVYCSPPSSPLLYTHIVPVRHGRSGLMFPRWDHGREGDDVGIQER